VTPAEYRLASAAWRRLDDDARREAADWIRVRGYAVVCAGPGCPVVHCTSLEDWDDAAAGRPLRAREAAGH
jgi:hypothetical protein